MNGQIVKKARMMLTPSIILLIYTQDKTLAYPNNILTLNLAP